MSYMMANKLVLTIRIESSLVKTFKGELIKVHLYLYDDKDILKWDNTHGRR